MSKVIVAATPLAGHTSPLIQITAVLVAAGHEVTFIGGERFTDQVVATGARMLALTGTANYDDRRLDELFPQRQALPAGPAKLNADLAQVFGDVIPDQHATLQQALSEAGDDPVLLSDQMFLGAWPSVLGVGRRPRRWLALAVSPLYVASSDTSPMGPVPVAEGQDAAAANLGAAAAFDAAINEGFSHVLKVLDGLGAKTDELQGYLTDSYRLPDLVLQPTVPEFEFPRRDLPANIRFIGPLPMAETIGWNQPSWWGELGTKPVVVVTQGTLANSDLSSLVAPTLQALAGEDVLVVAALGGRDPKALQIAAPHNARVERFVPFDRLLPHADVLVTNGGFGGVQVSLSSGTPVIMAGLSEDKPATAARVAFAGVGIDLATERPSPEAVLAAVRKVLSDSSFAERVSRMQRSAAEYDAMAAISALVAD